jgi:thiamine-phosphate pyrophosphorylase
MAKRYPLPWPIPRLLLLTDARTDAALPRALARLPRGSGVVFRHYHLSPTERRARFAALRRACRQRGLVAVLADSASAARRWRADGAYAAPDRFGHRTGALRLATAHSLREIVRAARAGADAVLLSPVHPTRSHPGGKALGPVRFALLARQSPVPVIALGGMTRARAARLPVHGWAAIDGLSGAIR